MIEAKVSRMLPVGTTDSSVGVLVPTDRGCIATNSFGFGVQLSGKYTSAEIFNIAVKHRPLEIQEYHPTVSDWTLYNKFVWTPWSRLNPRSGVSITKRCKYHTVTTQSDDIVDDYIGSKKKVDASWTNYIPVIERINLLSKVTTSTNNLMLLDLGCATGSCMLSMAAYGMNVYGVESHPEMYNHRSPLLQDRIVFGDALECLYQFKSGSFDVVIVSMLGNIWWHDVCEFFEDVVNLVHVGGIIILDTMPHKHVTLKARQMYRSAMADAGMPIRIRTDNMIAGVMVRK